MKYFILFILTITSINLIAKDPSLKQAYDFTGSDGRWVMGKVNSYPTQDGMIYVQNFARYFYEVEHPYELGNISYMSIPISKNTRNKSTSQEIKEMLEQMFDLKEVKLSNYNGKSNQWVIQGEYEKLGRYVRSIITQHSTRYSISTAFIRKPYLTSIDFSAIGIQNDLIQREEKLITENIPHKYHILDFIFSNAFAQQTGGSTPNPTNPCPSVVTNPPQNNCPSINTCPAPSNPAYLNCLGNISECRQKSLQIDLGILSAKAAQQSCLWNLSFNEAVKVIENIITPENIFKIATGGAAGVAAGTWATNLAIGGVEKGATILVQAMVDWVTGKDKELKHQQLVELFLRNKTDWEIANKAAMEIASFIDNSIELLELIKGSGKTLEDILAEKVRKQDELELDLIAKKQQFLTSLQDQSCSEEEQNKKKSKVLSLTGDLRQISQEIEKLMKIEKAGTIQSMCRNLNSNLDKLLQLEDGLQKARMNILASYDSFQVQSVREIDEQRERDLELAKDDPKEKLEELKDKYFESFNDAVHKEVSPYVYDLASKACFDDQIKIPEYNYYWHCQNEEFHNYRNNSYDYDEKPECRELVDYCSNTANTSDYMQFIYDSKYKGSLNKEQLEAVKEAYQKIKDFHQTYKSASSRAIEQYNSKMKTRENLKTNEKPQNIKDKKISDWVIALRTEQACQNSNDSSCSPNNTQCNELKRDCDKIRHNDICFNLSQSCKDSTCLQLQRKCDSYNLQTGCSEIISQSQNKKCENEQCKKQLAQCRSQANGNVLFRFENIKKQQDYIKQGVCADYIN